MASISLTLKLSQGMIVTTTVAGGLGITATISVGSVTTGAAGSPAQVINSGTPTAAILDFTIPRGQENYKGALVSADDNIDDQFVAEGVWIVNTTLALGTYPRGVSEYALLVVEGHTNFITQRLQLIQGVTAHPVEFIRNYNSTLGLSEWRLVTNLSASSRGGKVVLFGDSITKQLNMALLEELVEAEVIPVAVGGAQTGTHATAPYAPFSWWRIIKALISGDFSAQESTAVAANAVAQLDAMQDLYGNMNTVRSIFQMGCHNDRSNTGIIGSLADSIVDTPEHPFLGDTFLGSLRYSIQSIYTAWPWIRVGIGQPYDRVGLVPAMRLYHDAIDDLATKDSCLVDGVPTAVQPLHFPRLDVYNTWRLTPANAPWLLDGGLLHPRVAVPADWAGATPWPAGRIPNDDHTELVGMFIKNNL